MYANCFYMPGTVVARLANFAASVRRDDAEVSTKLCYWPYCGLMDSGLGWEGLRYVIEDMTEPRLLAVNGAGL